MNRIVLFIGLLMTTTLYSQNFVTFEWLCKDGVERPYIVYQPQSVDAGIEKPLLVYLHGAISSSLKESPIDYMKKSKMIALADAYGCYLMFCYGQKGASWFDSVGIDMILQEIEQAQQNFKINNNKIFLSGFSDGGSGVQYIAMNYPDSFAGFIAMNGSTNVAGKLGENGLFPENMNHKPMLVFNTQKDALYPVTQMKSTVDYLKKYNTNIHFYTPLANHEMSYVQTDAQTTIGNFIKENIRKPLDSISFEVDYNAVNNNLAWLNNVLTDTLLNRKKWHQPYTLKVFNDKAKFGMKYDYSYQGKGLKVKGFKGSKGENKKSTAENIGVEVGDIVLAMGGKEVESPYTPFYYMASKKAGDSTSLTVQRHDETLELKGAFNQGYDYSVFKNTKPSGKIKAQIRKHTLVVTTSRIKSFDIDYTKVPKKIKQIIINGTTQKVSRNAKIVTYTVKDFE